MRSSRKKSLDNRSAAPRTVLAKALAPEDIRAGDFVTMLHAIAELPSFLWCGDTSTLPREQPVRIQLIPRGAGIPLKVKSACLPFVLVQRPLGEQRTLDVRQVRLARLDRKHAKVTWKAYRKARSRRKRKEI